MWTLYGTKGRATKSPRSGTCDWDVRFKCRWAAGVSALPRPVAPVLTLHGHYGSGAWLTAAQVTFELHHTFTNPHRVCLQAPYEVTEQGWGEFDINITVSGRA